MTDTRTFRDALVADLEDVTVANGFATTLAEVSREPKRADELELPGVALTSGLGGSSEIDELGNRQGLATQTFRVDMYVRSATPNEDMDALLDDVRNAVERTTGNLVTNNRVEMVGVTEWSEPTTATSIHNGTYVRTVTVEVRYLYTRGSV